MPRQTIADLIQDYIECQAIAHECSDRAIAADEKYLRADRRLIEALDGKGSFVYLDHIYLAIGHELVMIKADLKQATSVQVGSRKGKK